MRLLAAQGSGFRATAERSLTLLHGFVAASAAILALGGLALTSILTRAVTSQAIDDRRTSLSQHVDVALRPALVQDGQLRAGPHLSGLLLNELKSRRDLVTVKVWRRDGVIAWTNRDTARIGKKFPIEGDLEEVLRTGEPAGSIDHLSDDEDRTERALGFDHMLEVYAPVFADDRRTVLGAYEIYANPTDLEHTLTTRRHQIWLAVGVVFLALWGALVLLVRGASRTLRRRSRELAERSAELLESYQRLEASSLEAVETLNATVDAKDPYTAGHSRRVQRVALAIGAEFDLTGEQTDALRFGALFHDIGKIAVPDAILVKPAKLDYWEYAQMKTHSAEGARIVSKFSRLRDAVPVIRHHHERWDGKGYPEGLHGDAIPLEAAIAGLADAWDAMTTDRPYHRALSVAEALDEVRRGRGTQFSPVVVDAFFAAAARRPREFGLERPPAPALQAV